MAKLYARKLRVVAAAVAALTTVGTVFLSSEGNVGAVQPTVKHSAGSQREPAVSTKSCLASANALLNSSEKSVPYTAPGPAFTITPAMKGKTIWFITPAEDFPYIVSLYQGFEAAAKLAGVSVDVFDGQSSPTVWNTGITEAINSGAGAIVLDGIDEPDISSAYAAAVAAKIPVISFDAEPGTSNYFSYDANLKEEGDYTAAAALVSSGCKGTYVIYGSSIFYAITQWVDAAQQYFKEHCPSCKFVITYLPLSDINTQIGAAAQTAVHEYRNLAAIMTPDVNIPGISAGLVAIHSKVPVIGYEGYQSDLTDYVAKGITETWDISEPDPVYLGWESLDLSLRAEAGLPAPNIVFPQRAVDKRILKNLKDNPFPWDSNPQKLFARLWKTS